VAVPTRRTRPGRGRQRATSVNDPAPGFRERNAREKVARGKWCCSCRSWLPVEAFRPSHRYRGGLDTWCKACHAQANRDWRERNPEAVAAYNAARRREYREAHPLPSRPCVVCGEPFNGRPDALVCDPECRQQRKLEQRQAVRK
jgi:hypothetical protein